MLLSPFCCGWLRVFEDEPFENEKIVPPDSLNGDLKDINEH